MVPSPDRARNVAVLLAGGVGVRVGLDIPKQLIKVAGRTILEHSLAALHAHPMVDAITVMMTPGHLDAVRAIVRNGGYDKVTEILEGGETRNETTMRALESLGDDECKVLFHDAVRPLLSQRIIGECFEALDLYPAVDVAIPSADTIIQVGDDNVIQDVPPRASLRRGQTPQAFRSPVIKRAYELAGGDPDFVATDDCTVVLRYLPDAADLGRAGRGAQHEGHRPDRRLPRRQALPADRERRPGHALRRRVPRAAGGQDRRRLRWQLRHRRRHRRPGRATRRDRLHVQPIVHQHPRRATRGPGGGVASRARRDGPRRLRRQRRGDPPARRADRHQRGDDLRRHGGQLPGTDPRRPGLPSPPEGDRRLADALHLQLLHPRPERLQPLLLGEGRHGQPHPGARRRVGRGQGARQLHQPGAHGDSRCGPRRSVSSRRARSSSRRSWRERRST